MQPILQATREQVPVSSGEAEREQGGVCDVEDRLPERHLGRQRRARLARAHGLAWHHGERLQSRGGLKARRLAVGADHEAAAQ